MAPTTFICEHYVTREQLAKELGVCARTIHRWEHSGELPRPVRIGRQVLHHYGNIVDRLAKMQDAA